MVFHSTGVYGLFCLVLDVTLTRDCKRCLDASCRYSVPPNLTATALKDATALIDATALVDATALKVATALIDAMALIDTTALIDATATAFLH